MRQKTKQFKTVFLSVVMVLGLMLVTDVTSFAYDDKPMAEGEPVKFTPSESIITAPETHQHIWTYKVDAEDPGKIVAHCEGQGDCEAGDKYLVLSAPENLCFDDTQKAAMITDNSILEAGVTAADISPISYKGVDDTNYDDSEAAPRAPGKYQASVTVHVTVNKEDCSFTAARDFTIRKLTFALAPDRQVYNGEEHRPEVSNVKLDDTWLVEGSDYDVMYKDNEKAGMATVRVVLKGNYAGEASKSFTIEKAEIHPIIEVASKAYDRAPVEPVVTDNPGEGITNFIYEKKDEAGNWSTFYGEPTDAGTYRAKADIVETDNYRNATTNTREFVISRANPVVRAPIARPGLMYTGAAQELVTGGSTTGGKMLYSLDGTGWTDSIPMGTNVGDYIVYYKVEGNDNYNGVGPKSIAVTIGPRSLQPDTDYSISLSNTVFVYNGSEQKPTVTVLLKNGTELTAGDDYVVTWSDDSTNAGNKLVLITFKGLYGGEAVEKEYRIAPMTLTEGNVTFKVNSFTYNGTAQGPDIVVADGSYTLVRGKDYTVQNGTAIKPSPAGDPYTVTVTGTGNYTGTVTGTYSINKDSLDSSTLTEAQKPSAGTLTYNGSDQALVTAPSSVPEGYSMQYSLDNSTWSAAIPKGRDAGTYNVYVKYRGDANHEDVVLTETIAVTIAKKSVVITPQAGQSKVFGTSEPATFAYSQSGVTGGDTLNGRLRRADGENVGEYEFTINEFTAEGANPNYDISLADNAPQFSITKADQEAPAIPILTATSNSVTVNNGKGGVTYTLCDGAGNPVSGKVQTPTADGSITFSGLDPAVKYTIKAQIAGDDNHNASEISEAGITTPKESQEAPTPTLKKGARDLGATDGVIEGVDGTMEYSTNGGETWVPVPSGQTEIGGLAPGEVLVRYEGNDTREPGAPARVMVTFKLSGTVTWNYNYNYVNPDTGEETSAEVEDGERSKYARVVLYDGDKAIPGRSEVVNVSDSTSAQGTYEFYDLPVLDDDGRRINYRAEVTPLMSDTSTDAAPGYSVNYDDDMHLTAMISYNRECFDAPWRVTVGEIDAPAGAEPDAVLVKVLYGTTAAGVSGGQYDGYDIIVQQSAGNGTACTLVEQSDGSYVAAGSCPVQKYQPWLTEEDRESYFYRILVTGYIADGEFFSLMDNPNNYIISGKDSAMWFNGERADGTMEVNISRISVPSVEFNANGGSIRGGYIVVKKGENVTAGQINARVPVWEGHTFDGWYTEAKGGDKQTADITGITGKQTLYAHWRMVVDPVQNAPAAHELTYNGQAQELVTAPEELPAGCKKIMYSLDGTHWSDDLPRAVAAGTYTIKVRYVGDGAHADEAGADLRATIRPAQLTPDMLSGKGTTLIYSGEAQGPTVAVRDGTTTLAQGTEGVPGDYALADATATAVGSYAAKVTGTGNYTGTLQLPYTIAPYELQDTDKLIIGGESSFVYNTLAQRPQNVTVKLVKADNNETTLREGADFEVEYPEESVSAGSYEIGIVLKNNYKGEAARGYKITPKPLTDGMVTAAPDTFAYSGDPQGPKITVRDTIAIGNNNCDFVLVKGVDYRITGETATGVGDGYKATILGTGNYMGRIEKPYAITSCGSGAEKLEIVFDGDTTFTYNGVDQRPAEDQISVMITGEDGSVAIIDKEDLNVKYLTANGTEITAQDGSKNAGSYRVQVELNTTSGYTGSASMGYLIESKPITAGDVEFNGLNGFAYSYSTMQDGTAMPQGPTVTVTSLLADGPATLTEGTEYSVADAPQGKAGSYTLVVKGMGNFCGEVTQTYRINKAEPLEGSLEDAYKPAVNKTGDRDGLVYNAKPQTLVNDPSNLPAGYLKVRYSTDDGTTWAETPTAIDAGVYTVRVKYVGDENHEDFEIAPLTATIVKRGVTITGASGTKPYTGRAQEIGGYSVNQGGGNDDTEGLASSGHGVADLSFLASGTDKGEYTGVFTPNNPTGVKIVDHTGTDVSANYEVILIQGKLTIEAASVTDDGTIDATGTGTANGTTAVEVKGFQGDNAPVYDAKPHKPVVVDKLATNENGYSAPRTLVEGTDYDVAYYKADDIESNGSPKSGATPVTPEEAGEKVVLVTLKGNYSGTIKVRADVKQRSVSFTGESATRTYTGGEQELTGITIGGEGLVSGHTHNLGYLAKGTAVSTGDTGYTGSFTFEGGSSTVIKDGSGADVTKNYAITTTPGKLTINVLSVDANQDGTADYLTDGQGSTVKEDGKPVPIVSLIGTDGTTAPVYDDQDHKPKVFYNGYVNPATGKREQRELTENTDYTVRYYEANSDGTPDKNKEITADPAKAAGDKAAVVTFKGSFEGSLTVPADVRKRVITIIGKSVTANYDSEKHTMADRIGRIVEGDMPFGVIEPDDPTADKATRKMTYTVVGENVTPGLVSSHKVMHHDVNNTYEEYNGYDIKNNIPVSAGGSEDGYPIAVGTYETGFYSDEQTIAICRSESGGGVTDVTANYDINLRPGTYTILPEALHDNGNGYGVLCGNSSNSHVIHVVGKMGENAPVYDGTPKEPDVYAISGDQETPLVRGRDYKLAFYAVEDITFGHDNALNTNTIPQVKSGATPLACADAGEKYALVTIKTDNYTGTIAVRMEVKKRPVTITGGSFTKTYTGSEQSISDYEAERAGNTGDRGLLNGHKITGLTYVAKGTSVGTYTGVFNPETADDVSIMKGTTDVSRNYAVTLTPGSLTIQKADPVVTPPSVSSVYGQTIADVELTNPEGNIEGTWTWVDAGTIPVGGAGENVFKANFTPSDTDNYNSLNNVDVTVIVGKADPDAAAPTGLTATYGQTLAEVTLNNPDGNTSGTWAWMAEGTTSVGNAGDNTFKASFTPTDVNYKTVENVDVTITVGKAANPATVTGTATVIKYGNTVDLKDNVTMNGATGDVGCAIDGEAKGCTLNGSVLTSGDTTGTVTVNVTVAADGNYYALAATPITVTIIDKGTQTITAGDVTVTYGETGRKVSVGVTDPATGGGAISYAVKDGSGDYIDVDATTGVLTIKKVPGDGKAYVAVTAAGTAAYEQATRDVTVTINKANAVSATVAANNRTYDGTEKPLVTEDESTLSGGTMWYALGVNATIAPADNLYTTSIPAKIDVGT